MIAALVVALVLLVAFIIYTVVSQRSASAGTVVAAPARTPVSSRTVGSAVSAPDDEEATRVRVAGPRLVRTMGGLRVGDEMSITGFVTIGRGQNCTYKFQDAEMSSVHAEFRVEGDTSAVIDLASTNGTFVNDQRIDANVAVPLKDGDQVKLGITTFLFKKSQ